jgi:hypothetical protein
LGDTSTKNKILRTDMLYYFVRDIRCAHIYYYIYIITVIIIIIIIIKYTAH